MKNIEEFAGAPGGASSANERWEPYLEKAIEDYLESESVLRQFCTLYRLNGTYVANLPKSHSTGTAVEIVEATEIPAVRQVISTVDVKVSANGTAIEMTDEAKKMDWYGDLAAREVEEALKRMLRKENNDIIDTLVAGATSATDGLGDNVLTFEDLVDAKTYLEVNFYNPNIALVNPNQYADLVKDDMFRDFAQSGSTAPLREGTIGGNIAGLNIVVVPEVPDKTVLVMDTSVAPLWLVILQELEVESFRIPDRRMEKVQMTNYEKPAVLKPEAIRKINIVAATP